MRKLCRGIKLVLCLGFFIVRTATIKLIYGSNKARCNFLIARATHQHSRYLLKIFNVNIELSGSNALSSHEPCLIVANHMSYIDILLISSLQASLFLSHTGIQKEPLIGWIAESGGTLFVDKSTRAKLQSETERFAEMMRLGNTVTLFPEGHSGNGDKIDPFHSAFISAAILVGKDVLPICIQYLKYNGIPVTKVNRDNLCIYDKMPFISHIVNVYKTLESVDISITVGDRISTTDGKDRKEIAEIARNWLISVYKPFSD